MAVLWLKILHVLSISFWMAGLVALPLMLLRAGEPATGGAQAAARLQHAARQAYLVALSPAAIMAVITGLALAGQTRLADDWFALKLWLVAGLAIMHVLLARQIIGTFGAAPAPTRNLLRASASVSAGLALAVLVTVLAKPALPDLGSCLDPGALRQLAQSSVALSSCGSTASP